MAEIDPLVLELVAKVNSYEADLRRATRTVDQQMGLQGARVRKLEDEFRRSSGAISSSIKGLASTLATAFTGQQLVGLIDSYTRLQNSLKVTGLEGEKLADVQKRLFDVAQLNGVELEAVGQLYSRAAQNQKELGASTSDLIGLTRAVAASLRISGTSTQEASGSLLQLGQALGSPRIQAEEFNSLLDTMQPLLREAAKNIEGTGGTLAGLTQRIKDTNGPGVSNVELFRAITAALASLEKQAAASQITIGGAFTTLNNALVEYVGSTATATGVTGAFAAGIEKLADNLDTIIPAIATIATVLGVKLVVSYGAATVASVALSASLAGNAVQMGVVGAASFALQARLAGAATSMEALAFASRGALATLSGPLGIAIGAVAVGMAVFSANSDSAANSLERLKARTSAAEQEADAMEARLRAAGVSMENVGVASGVAEAGIDGVSRAARGAQGNLAALEQQAIRTATALVDVSLQENSRSRVELARIDKLRAPQRDARGRIRGGDPEGLFGEQRRAERKAQADALDDEFKQLTRKRNAIIAGVRNGVDVTSGAGVAAQTGTNAASGKPSKGSAATGPSDADRAARFLNEQARLDAEILQSKINLATSIEDRAAAERQFLTFQGNQRRADIEAQVKAEEITEAQGKALKEQIDALYGVAAQYDEQNEVIATYNNSLIAQELRLREQADIERQRLDVLDQEAGAEIEGLRLQFDLADTQAERRRIALQILDAEQRLALAKEEEVLQSQTASDEAKRLAQLRKDALNSQAPAQREATSRQFEGPLARYARSAKDTDDLIEQAAVRRIEDLNQTITDAMTNALGIKDPFLSELIRIFLDRNIFGPLAEALSSQGAGGSGDLFSSLVQIGTSLFGRASGGPVSAGRAYRVNEGASPGRVEAFVPNTGGQIIPLGRMNAMQPGGAQQAGGVVRVIVEEAPGFAARVQAEATGVAVEVVRQTAGQIIDAAANETFRRANRPGL